MEMTGRARAFGGFAGRSALVHTLTYLVFGFAARSLLDYDALWREPWMRETYRPLDSPWVLAGPLVQPLRGVVFAAALWPLRSAWLSRPRGWLVLWGLLVALAILGTAAAAPGSIEGVLYTRLPLRIHLIGLPELLGQTLAYAWLLHRWERAIARARAGAAEPETRVVLALKAGAVALLGFVGTAVSGALGAWHAQVAVEAVRALPGTGLLLAALLLGNAALALGFGRRIERGTPAPTAVEGVAFYALNALLPVAFNLAAASPLPAVPGLALGALPAALAWAGTRALWRPRAVRSA